MKIKNVELSIIVPVYNVEQYLERCLDSLYSINNIDKEIILVDDGSEDNSLKILKKYKEKYCEITKLISTKKVGVSEARNIGLRNTSGKYISFIDSDDWINNKKYEEFFKKGQKEEVDIMIGNYSIFNGGAVFENDIGILKDQQISGKKYLLESLKKNKYRVVIWNKIYKRDIIFKNKIFFEKDILHEDELFTPMILIHAEKIKCYNLNYYYYRQREGSIMKTKSLKNEIFCIYIFSKLLLDKNFSEEEFKKHYFQMYQSSVIRTKVLYLKECLKIIFCSNIKFKDKLFLLIRIFKYVREIRWTY